MGMLVRAAALTNYFEVMQRLGVNPQPLLRRAGLSRAMLADVEQRIPLNAVVGLLEDSAQETGCATIGLQMAELRQLSDFGAISLLLTHQRTLRDALRTIVDYRHLLNESLAISIEDAGERVIVREDIVLDDPVPSRQAIELAVGVLYRLCSALMGANFRPYTVNFAHPAPPDTQVHRRLFRCRLKFDAGYAGFVCNASDLDLLNPAANPAMARYARQFMESLPRAREPSILLDVRRAIYILLPLGRAGIEQIAPSLGMNVRTLQRRLDAAGLSFGELVCEVRRQLVLRYLENPAYSLGRIAHLLGYSAQSSFTRWFVAQFGEPPAQWRAARRGRSAAK